jgi:hypothetical protein
MAVVTVRPNGTISGSGNFTLVGGGATAHATLNDDSDTTYLQNSTSGVATLVLDMGTTTIPSNEMVRRVRVRARVLTPTTSGKVNINLGTKQGGLNKYYNGLAIRGQNSSATTLTGAWFSVSPFGGAWSQTDINSLRVQVTEYKTGADEANIYEIYVDVDDATEPTTTVTAPTGTVTDTAKQEVAFTYTDPDNADEQALYEVKVYSAAQYGASGFSPDINDPTYFSGTISSVEQTHTVTQFLDNATYRAYVRVGKRISGTALWSDWAYSQFTLNATRPATPTLAASWDNATSRATITVTGTSSGSFDSQYFEVQRSVDGGATYATVRGGAELIPAGGFASTVYDYEVKRGVSASYRARSIGIVGSNELNSAFSTVATITITSDGKFWLKAVSQPSLNYGDAIVLNRLGVTIEENLGVFRPLGRALPLIVSGTIGGSDGELEVVTTTSAEWNAVYALAIHQYTILLQEPTNEQKYVRFIRRDWEEVLIGTVRQRLIRIAYVEVDGEE